MDGDLWEAQGQGLLLALDGPGVLVYCVNHARCANAFTLAVHTDTCGSQWLKAVTGGSFTRQQATQ